jgi:hypothetical protein
VDVLHSMEVLAKLSLLEGASAPPFGNCAPATPRWVSRESRTVNRGVSRSARCKRAPPLRLRGSNVYLQSLTSGNECRYPHFIDILFRPFMIRFSPFASQPPEVRQVHANALPHHALVDDALRLLPSHSVENLTHDGSAARRHFQSLTSH